MSHFSVEQLPEDEPDYDAYGPQPCPFCGENICECNDEDDDADT